MSSALDLFCVPRGFRVIHAGGQAVRRPEHSPDRQELPPDIRRVLSYIEENAFDSELNVQKIKLDCRLRDNNVSSRFRFFLGATIRDYLESRRMKAAADLLMQSRATILEVAFAVGYNNLQTFYGAFRRKYSCTPDAYRRRVGGSQGTRPAPPRRGGFDRDS